MTRPTRNVLLVFLAGALLGGGAVIVAQRLVARWAYQNWLSGQGEYRPEYLERYIDDGAARDATMGRDVGYIHKLFPILEDGDDYAENSYRGEAQGGRRERREEYFPNMHGPMKFYWLPGRGFPFGLCFIVIDGKVRDLALIKG
jgi:hypothetical protein